MHFIDRQGAVLALVVLLGAYLFHARGLFALYHLIRAAELMRVSLMTFNPEHGAQIVALLTGWPGQCIIVSLLIVGIVGLILSPSLPRTSGLAFTLAAVLITLTSFEPYLVKQWGTEGWIDVTLGSAVFFCAVALLQRRRIGTN